MKPTTIFPAYMSRSFKAVVLTISLATIMVLKTNTVVAQRAAMYRNVASVNLGVGAINTIPAFAGGVEYERVISPDGLVSVTAGFQAYRATTFYLGGASIGDIDTRLTGFYAAPGFRINAFRNSRRFYMGVGASFPFGTQNRKETKIDASTRPPVTNQSFYGAAMLQANMNFIVKRRLVGVFMNLGGAYECTHKVLDWSKDSGFALLIGARFGGQF